MANNTQLKAAIAEVIKTNGNKEITGATLQAALLSIINHFGQGAIFAGVATPATIPLNQDVNMFYFAYENGIYPNFGGYENTDNKLVIFINTSGSWAVLDFFAVNSIVKIEKTDTVDNIDTYTITYTNGGTFVFTITNAIDGVTKSEFDEVSSLSINLADKTKFRKGYSVGLSQGTITSGTNPNNNVLIIKVPKKNTVYSIRGISFTFVGNGYGIGANPADISTFNNDTRVLTFGDNLQPQPKTSFEFNSGADMEYIAINVGVDANLETVMFYEGTLASNPPYAAFGRKLKATAIAGVIPGVVYNAEFTAAINLLQSQISVLNDKTDIIVVQESLNLANKANILQGYTVGYGNALIAPSAGRKLLIWKVPKKNTVYSIVGISTSYIGRGYRANANPSGIYPINQQAITDNPNILAGFNESTTTGTLSDNVGAKYQWQFNSGEDMEYVAILLTLSGQSIEDTVMIYEGTLDVIPPYEPFGNKKGIMYDNVIGAPSPIAANYPKCYFSYSPTVPQALNGRFVAYTHIRDEYYAGFNIDRVLNGSIRADLWRIRDAFIYRLANGQMVSHGVQLLFSSENEYVYAIQGASDSTGGYHGDEILSDIKFMANGCPVNIAAEIPLTACDTLHYQQKSNTFNPDDATTPPIVVASHLKRTIFENGAYITINDLDFKIDVNISSSYGGLSCVHPNVGDSVYSRQLNVFQRSGGNLFPLTEVGSLDKIGEINYFNPTTKASAKGWSEWQNVIKNGVDSTRETWLSAEIRAWDRTTDFKYYHRNTTLQAFKVGDRIQSIMKMQFFI